MTYAPTQIKSPFDERSMKNGGAAALTTKRIVKYTADKTVDVATTSTDKFAGILSQSSGVAVANDSSGTSNAVGAMENVQVRGKGVLTAGGVIAVGDPVTSDSTGRGISAAARLAAGTPTSIIGTAATAASGADVDFEIEVYPGYYSGNPALSVADHAALKAIAAANRYDGQVVITQNDNAQWRFAAAATATDTSENLVISPTAGTGKWLRVDSVITMVLPFTKDTADATALFTTPAGAYVKLLGLLWNVTTSFTGGASSAIGVSSDLTGYATKGNLLGGASGDVAATLVQTGAKYKAGTIGATFSTNAQRDACVLAPANIIRADLVTSQFTAGVGNVIVAAQILANPGA